MTKTDVYNSDYTALNHSYIQIYETYEKLLEVDDADPEIMDVLGRILMVFNPTLDKIKSEMTVKTRFKDGSKSSDQQKDKPAESSGPIILHGNFTGE
ncbi:MAG: hypothetical protein KBT11_09460 [Treponema sp.]|nr:hypothetical protein [Candidatus Treponema equifaecale]